MKILHALKKIKHLDRKIEKTLKRIGNYCSVVVDNDNDAGPAYSADDIRTMQQQVRDWATHKAAIRGALHLTNVRTKVEFGGKNLSIDELLLLQNIVIPAEMACLTSLRRKEKGGYRNSDSKDSWVVMQYNPKERDMAIEKLENKKEELDMLLDNLNIETDVVGLAD
jgi:hypothetical protein